MHRTKWPDTLEEVRKYKSTLQGKLVKGKVIQRWPDKSEQLS